MAASSWTNDTLGAHPWVGAFPEIDSAAAAERILGTVTRTAIVPLPAPQPAHPDLTSGLELLGKMENRQVTGSFKSRGALNNALLLTPEEKARGVVASSSGNHGRALAWAARRAGAPATIVMPKDAYPNKIAACREEEANVVLAEDRIEADVIAERLAGEGAVWVHPYDRSGTVEGAGTVGLEIAQDRPDVDVVVLCVGGGGLSSGSALALRRALGERVIVIGAEPEGAAAMTAGLAEGRQVQLDRITSDVQGLTTPYAGHLNLAIASATLDATRTVSDGAIFAAQRRLVNDEPDSGWRAEVVEPAGAAAYALALEPDFPAFVRGLAAARGLALPSRPLRVCVTISGGNPAPAQLAELQR